MKTKQEQMQLFLNQNYITLTELAKKHKTSEKHILDLEHAQCIPGHTYEVRRMVMFSCAGIDTAVSESLSHNTNLYYHRSISSWVESALDALKKIDLNTLAEKIKHHFSEQLDIHLKGVSTPGCQSFDQAWAYWIDGTWGKCLKVISVECLAKKELARQYIAECMHYSSDRIKPDRKNKLSHAVKQYTAASLDFDPYGMRHILAKEAIEKFDLNITLDYRYFS